jgi:hypothetical protein
MGDIATDHRMLTLLDMLFNRFDNVEFDFVLTTVWSLGILVGYRGAEIPTENKMKIINELIDSVIPNQSLPNIPSLLFSISCMLYPDEVNDDVYKLVRELSNHYLEEGIDLMEPLQASTLLMSFSRLNYHNEEFLYKICTQLKRDRYFFNSTDQDLVNIINSFADLRYKDDKVIEAIHEEITIRIDDMKPYNVYILSQSYARLIPDQQEYYMDIAHRIIEVLTKDPDQMDVQIYANQWLTLACFKGTENKDSRIHSIAKTLIKLMSHQDRFSYADFSSSDASNILVAVSTLRLKDLKFINNLVSVIVHTPKLLSNMDLLNMSKSSFYLKSFEELSFLYEMIHSECVQRLTSFSQWERTTLEEIYTEHNQLHDSPFVTHRK